MKNKFFDLRIVGYLLLFSSFILIIYTIRFCLGTDIWYDEIFSVGLVPYSFSDIISLTAKDVHPPFYYFYIKLIDGLVHVFLPNSSTSIIAKFGSLLPMFGLLGYSYFFFRKKMSVFVAGLYMWCICTMPQIMAYSVEIRMYSLALFFISATYYHSMELARKPKTVHWLILGIYGILTVYTQYFAGIAIVGIYLSLFVWLMITNKKQIKYWLITVSISVFCYIPWLIVLWNQLSQVRNSYWIQPLTFRSIFGCLKYIFMPIGYPEYLAFGVAGVLIAGFALLFFRYIWKRYTMIHTKLKTAPTTSGSSSDNNQLYEYKFQIFQVISGLFPLFLLVFVGFAVSMLVQPVFVYRYMIPALGCMWLVFAILLDDAKEKLWITIPLLLVIGLSSKWTLDSFRYEETKKVTEMNHTESVLSAIAPEDFIICNFDHVQGVVGYYLENDSYLWCGTPESLIQEIYGSYYSIDSTEEVIDLLHTGKTVWYLGSFNAREEIISLWAEDSIVAEEVDSCLLERYWFNLYKLSLES